MRVRVPHGTRAGEAAAASDSPNETSGERTSTNPGDGKRGVHASGASSLSFRGSACILSGRRYGNRWMLEGDPGVVFQDPHKAQVGDYG